MRHGSVDPVQRGAPFWTQRLLVGEELGVEVVPEQVGTLDTPPRRPPLAPNAVGEGAR